MRAKRQSLRRNMVTPILLVIGIASIGFVFWKTQRTGYTPDESGALSEGPKIEDQAPVIEPAPVPENPGESSSATSVELTPQSVIGNLNCRLLAGHGAANDTAVVVLPTENGARFEILNGEGTVFGGSLPFTPHHFRLGKRPDGTVLAGFGDLRLNSNEFRESDTTEPVRIYMDGQIIYDSDKAWDFEIASDGSSFYVHEPMAGNASRLVIRNLDLGREDHFDLGAIFSPVNAYESDFASRYSVGEREVMFMPAYADSFGRGPHHFYSAAGGEVRQIQVGQTGAELISGDGTPEIRVSALSSSSAVFASSETGYFADISQSDSGSDTYRIIRRKFQYGSDNHGSMESWSRDIALTKFNGRMTLSDNGEWLAVHAWNIHVLDTANGETLFEYPLVGDKQAELARLANVLEPGATVADVGNVSGVSFLDSRLLISRRFGSLSACSGSTAQYNQCVADLRQRGIYLTVVDVFEMNNVDLRSQPEFRFEYSRFSPCESGDFPLRGLQVHENALTFLTTRR